MFLFVFAGCSRKSNEIDFLNSEIVDLNNNITTLKETILEESGLYNTLSTTFTEINNNLDICKNNYNKLKLKHLTPCKVCKNADCTTCTMLLNEKEVALEKCWMNVTIYNKTYTNNTLINMYEDCNDKLIIINNTWSDLFK